MFLINQTLLHGQLFLGKKKKKKSLGELFPQQIGVQHVKFMRTLKENVVGRSSKNLLSRVSSENENYLVPLYHPLSKLVAYIVNLITSAHFTSLVFGKFTRISL